MNHLPPPTALSFDRGIIYLDEVDTPSFTCCAYFSGGTALESAEISGVTHFIEHLLFHRRVSPELSVREAILKFGLEANAFTSWQGIGVHIRTSQSKADNAIHVLSAMINQDRLHVLAEDLEKERQVVLREIEEVAGKPEVCLTYQVLSKIYSQSSGLSRPITGSTSSVKNLSSVQINQWARQVLSNWPVTVVMSGSNLASVNINPLEDILSKSSCKYQIMHDLEELMNPDQHVFGSLKLYSSRAHAVLAFAELPYGVKGYEAAQVRALVLADEGSMGGRLREHLSNSHLNTSCVARYQGFRTTGQLFITLAGSMMHIEKAIELSIEMLTKPDSQFLPSASQVEAAKHLAINRILRDTSTTNKRAILLARLLGDSKLHNSVDSLMKAYQNITVQDLIDLPQPKPPEVPINLF